MKCEKVSLFDLACWKNGLAFKNIQFADKGKPIIKIAELKNGITTQTRFTEQVFDDNVSLKKGDMLFSWSGNPETSIDVYWYELPDGWLNQHIFKVTPKEFIDKFYLYYLLKSFKKVFTNIASNKQTTGLGHVTVKDLKEIFVNLPDLSYQRLIGEYLNKIDEKIRINNRINDNLEKQVHALFRAWFVDFLPFDGQIPSNWRYVSFSDILTPRVEKSSDPSLQMFSVTDTGIHPRNEKFKKKLSMSGTKSKIIYQDDLVFGMSREILNWGVMRWPVGGVSSAYNVFSVCKDINTYYLETYMRSNIHYFKDLIRPASREGQGIDKNALMHKEILMPPENVLHSYYHHEDTLTRLIHNNIDENTHLSIIRYTLLPKLMFGEIDVSDIQL